MGLLFPPRSVEEVARGVSLARGLCQLALEPQGKRTLLKIRGVRVLPAWIFAIGTKKGSAGPWQPLRPVATPSGDAAYPLLVRP